jgi:hypothetical protein
MNADGRSWWKGMQLGREGETVEAGLFSKPVEFDGFKSWVVQMLPKR